ncbi:PepSY domain-containing protein [Vagococcus hydrophili]|uniref:Lysis protein n=1 Tax=Vagococcus hydrophili TaxID=2714947 RepID=A0A6G8AUM7_9ENTE|nr:PepSY domain-containing protein [Vagococcus hydrophili]QIL48706.1 lysis protein [Vagococcus hydrophili]
MKKIIMTGLAVVLLGAMAGCSSQTEIKKPVTETKEVSKTTGSSSKDTKTSGSKDTKTSTDTKSLNEVKIITLNEASEIYTKAHPKTDIISMELEYEKGDFFYKVKGVDDTNKYKMLINASSKEIKKDKEKKLESDDKVNRAEAKLGLKDIQTVDKVTEIAEKEAGAGKAKEWQLKKELGVTFWEVEVKDGHKETKVKLDAKSGKVLEKKQED